MNSNAMTSIGQGRCHAENDASGILSLNWRRGDNNGLEIGAYKNGLPLCLNQYYTAKAPAKSGVRIGLLVNFKATDDAPSVFFYVVCSEHPSFNGADSNRIIRKIMVGCAGASSEAPVSLKAGKTNSAQFTTRQIGLCGGDLRNHFKEAATMATTLATPQTKFTWRFLALNRHDKKAMPCRLSVEAVTEREARRILAPHFILSLAARLPVPEVRHV